LPICSLRNPCDRKSAGPYVTISAKLLLRALGENLVRYEAAFGEINVPVKPLWQSISSVRTRRLNRQGRQGLSLRHPGIDLKFESKR